MQTFPALSLAQLMLWLRQVQASPTLEGMAPRALAAVLVTFHNSLTGWTFPSIRTLARLMGCSTKTVIAAYRALEKDGWLQHIARRSGPFTRDKMSHQYVLILRDDPAENQASRTPARGGMELGGVWEAFPQRCVPQDNRGVGTTPTKRLNLNDKPEGPEEQEAEQAPQQAATDTPETGKRQEEERLQAAEQVAPEQTDTRKAAQTDTPEAKNTDLLPCSEHRLVRLAQRFQRLADGRGWRMENARAAVENALRRAGTEPVERLISKLEEGHCRPAYELRGMLEGVRREHSPGQAAKAAPGPFDAAYQRAAELYRSCRPGGGVVDFSCWKRIEARLTAAGIAGPFRWNDKPGMIAAMAQAIRAGTLAPAAV